MRVLGTLFIAAMMVGLMGFAPASSAHDEEDCLAVAQAMFDEAGGGGGDVANPLALATAVFTFHILGVGNANFVADNDHNAPAGCASGSIEWPGNTLSYHTVAFLGNYHITRNGGLTLQQCVVGAAETFTIAGASGSSGVELCHH